MNALAKLKQRIHQKGLGATLKSAFKHYVFFHWELLWMERDLVSPVPPHTLKPYAPLRVETITVHNVQCFARDFGDRVDTMRELAAEGHTGLMFLNDDNDAVAFIWGSLRHYHDRHYYGCWFPVEPGEFFAMLGPSGSGKTTCLRLIAGFEQPTSGHIEIFGETAEGVPPYRRNVNTVFQD